MIIIIIIIITTIVVILHILSRQPRAQLPTEKYYINPQTQKQEEFPSLSDQPTVFLSIVIPAYKETNRLPHMLKHTLSYLKSLNKSFEIIVVDDGSNDGTSECAYEFASTQNTDVIRVMTLAINRGKGGAVTQGILHARGEYILFVDADDATDIRDTQSLLTELTINKYDVAVGSRAHLVSTTAVVKRSFIRNLLMHSFHLFVQLLTSDGVKKIRDTQCMYAHFSLFVGGFKMFSRRAAQLIFPCMHIEGWIFDVEILHLAYLHGLRVSEVSVTWHEVEGIFLVCTCMIEGSKLNLVKDSIKMAIDLLVIRLLYIRKVSK